MITLTAIDFNRVIKACQKYTNQKDGRELCKVIKLRQVGQTITATALDGNKLMQKVVAAFNSEDKSEVCYIPGDTKPVRPDAEFVEITNTADHKATIVTKQGAQTVSMDYIDSGFKADNVIPKDSLQAVMFDKKLLIDALSGIESKTVIIEFFGGNKGIVLRSPDSRALVLPMHYDENNALPDSQFYS